MATGDFDEPAGDDVAVGAAGETVNGRGSAGAVSVFNGPPNGLASERLLFQGTAGIPGSPESEDRFGSAVAPTDSNGIGQWDLAVGVPFEDVGPDVDTGVVNLLAGSATGPSGGSLLQQGNPEDFDYVRVGVRRRVLPARLRPQRLLRPRRGRPLRGPSGTAGGRRRGHRVRGLRGRGGTVTPGRCSPRGGGLGGTAETADLFGFALE